MELATEKPANRIMRTNIGVMTYLAPASSSLDENTLEDLHAEIKQCIQENETQLVVDLSSVQKLTSIALEALLDVQEALIKSGGTLKIVNASQLLGEVFRTTGISDLITILDSGDQSIALPPMVSANKPTARLGDILIAKGLVRKEQIEEAIDLQKRLGKRMGNIIIDKAWASEKDVLEALGEQMNLPYVRLRKGLYDGDVITLLDRDAVLRLKVVPLFKVRNQLTLATTDPHSVPTFEEVEEKTGCRIRVVLARQEDILKTINEAYEGSLYNDDFITDVEDDLELVEGLIPDDYSAIDEMATGSPVINLVNSLIQRAVHDGASDIHIEPSRKKSRVRFRIDGILYEVMTPKVELHPAIISRLKVMANLDIAERRLPQDGRIQVHTQGRSVDLRFSSLPGLFGEKVVLRVLDKNQAILDVNRLGLSADNLSHFKKLLGRSYGLVLVTGPTGSGKTTSLYAALNHLNSIEKNIVTIEEPVEYQVDIVNQNEVKENIGLSFAMMLKHVLRQDPDIVMVGEIRERETAEIAVQAALTGHLVLSTLHTNDSIGAVTRMIDMGVEPYLLSSALIGVVAQRLVRTVCPACKTNYIAQPEVISRYGWENKGNVRLTRGRGCPECYDSGYKGRAGLHEILEMDGDLQKLMIGNPSRDELAAYIHNRGVKTLFDDGLDRVLDGITTIEEISRVINA